ncbi:unnamed protein product [Caenorhabditis auriculariae]|uniref:Uncharacterized protein n=1 Tax=Caenorhabditis auriculariae TaxID=2777116 RepID=A0A8S1H009_9PELO|nr:unnamed protein product [Caenorhabditis auriculariae]
MPVRQIRRPRTNHSHRYRPYGRRPARRFRRRIPQPEPDPEPFLLLVDLHDELRSMAIELRQRERDQNERLYARLLYNAIVEFVEDPVNNRFAAPDRNGDNEDEEGIRGPLPLRNEMIVRHFERLVLFADEEDAVGLLGSEPSAHFPFQKRQGKKGDGRHCGRTMRLSEREPFPRRKLPFWLVITLNRNEKCQRGVFYVPTVSTIA